MNAARKQAQLLRLAGMEVHDIYEDLQDPGPVTAETDCVFSVRLRKLDAHFRADDIVLYGPHVFHQLAPMQGKQLTNSWSLYANKIW